ncbi:MAG: putative two-component system response regulator [Pirellulaceae bacterium]
MKRTALDMGATDLLNKPVDQKDLIARIRSSVKLKQQYDELKGQHELLKENVQRTMAELWASQLEIILKLRIAAEDKYEDTGNHIIRVGCFSRAVAIALKLDEEFIDTLVLAAPLHDIGRVNTPDAHFLKSEKSDDEKQPPRSEPGKIGRGILSEDAKLNSIVERYAILHFQEFNTGQRNPVVGMAAEIATYCRERWDGSGYPDGLSGDDIPLSARIVAIALVYDALRSHFRKEGALSTEKALEYLSFGSGTLFDPRVYNAFVASFDEIQMIETEFADDLFIDSELLDEIATC